MSPGYQIPTLLTGAQAGGAELAIMRMPRSVVFGRGALHAVGATAAALGRSALVVTDATIGSSEPGRAASAALRAAGVTAHVFTGAEPELPLRCVAAATAFAAGKAVDVIVGLGGGSCLDLAKLVALELSHSGDLSEFYGENAVPGPVIPVVAVPTTAGTGSEVTPVAVLGDPERRLKVGISSPQLVPHAAICDPMATVGCPPAVTAYAGADALVHALEAFTASRQQTPVGHWPWPIFQGKNPLSDLFARSAIEVIGRSLERAVADGGDLGAREDMLFGSLCGGIAFARAGTAGAHALQYVVGAATKTPHGLGVALLAPYTLQYCAPACEQQLQEIAEIWRVDDAIAEVERLTRSVGIPHTLRELGVQREELGAMAVEAAGIERLLRNSPRPMDADAILEILEAAWDGDRERLRAEAPTVR